MKKIIMILLVILVLVLVSCNSTSSNRDYLIFYVWGDSSEVSWYEAIAEKYEEKGGCHVKVEPAVGEYYNNLNIKLGSKKSAPDIFFTEMGEIQGQLNQKKVLDLTPYIDSKALDIVTENNPNGKIKLWDVNDAYRYDGTKLGQGNLYAVIKDWSPDFVMWYNKDHIDEYNAENNLKPGDDGYMEYPSETIPMTWDEFSDMSYKLTKVVNNKTRYGTMIDRVPWKHLMEFIQMNGSTMFDSNNKYLNSDDSKFLEAFKFFTDLQIGPKASAPKIGVSGINSGDSFANGDVSIVWYGSWAYSSYYWNSVSFEIGMAPAPVPSKGRELTADDTYLASSGMISLAIYKNTPLVDKAVDFLNFYMTYGQEYMAKKAFNIPGNQLVAESDTFLDPENAKIKKINNYFYNLALNYTHTLTYNQYISQLLVENQFGKNISSWYNNLSADTYESILAKIKTDIKNELE